MQQLAVGEQAQRIAAFEASQRQSLCQEITLYLDDAGSHKSVRFDRDDFNVRYSSEFSGGEVVNWVCEEGMNLAKIPRKFVHQFNLLHKGMGVIVFDQDQNIFVHQRASTKRIFPSMYDMFIGGVSEAGESSEMTLIRELNEEAGIDLLETFESEEDIGYIYARKEYADKVQNRIRAYQDRKIISWETAFDLAYANYKTAYIPPEKLRELEPPIPTGNSATYLGNTICYTTYNHCFVDVYAVVIDEKSKCNIKFKDGEIQAGEWISTDALNQWLAKDEEEKDNEKEQVNGRHQFVPDGLLVFDDLSNLMNKERG